MCLVLGLKRTKHQSTITNTTLEHHFLSFQAATSRKSVIFFLFKNIQNLPVRAFFDSNPVSLPQIWWRHEERKFIQLSENQISFYFLVKMGIFQNWKFSCILDPFSTFLMASWLNLHSWKLDDVIKSRDVTWPAQFSAL